MARTPTMKAIIDVIANTKDAEGKLHDLEKIAAKLEKDGTVYKLEADASDMIKVKKIVDEIKADSKNKIAFFEIDEKLNTQIEKFRKETNSLSEAIQKLYQSGFDGSLGKGIGTTLGEAGSEIESLNAKLKEQNDLYEKQVEIINELNSKIDNAKNAKDTTAIDKQIKEHADSYKKLKEDVQPLRDKASNFEEDLLKKTYKNYVSSVLKKDDKKIKQSKASFIYYFEQFGDYVKDIMGDEQFDFKIDKKNHKSSFKDMETVYNSIKEDIWNDDFTKELDKADSDLQSQINKIVKPYEEKKKELISIQKEIANLENQKNIANSIDNSNQINSYEKELEKAQSIKKQIEAEIKAINDQINSLKSKTSEENVENKQGNDTTGKSVSTNVEPANLEEFYKKIEEYRTAKIKVDVDDENLKEKQEKIENKQSKEDLKIKQANVLKQEKSNGIWDGVDDKSKELIKYIDSQRKVYNKEKGIDLYGNISNLLHSSIESKTPLDNKQVADLVALVESYKKISGKDSPVSEILKYAGVNKSNYDIPGYEELKKQYRDVLKKSNSLKKEKLNKTSLEDNDNKTNIENKPEEVSIDVKLNVDQSEIESLKNKIEIGLGEVNVKLSNGESISNGEDKNSLNSVYEKYKEILLLQQQIKNGNTDLLPTYSSSGKKLTTKGISEEDIRGQSVKKSSIQNLVKEYNELYKKAVTQEAIDKSYKQQGKEVQPNTYKQQLDELKEKITLYAASYKDLQSLTSIKVEGESFWSDVIIKIQNAIDAQQAYLQIGEKVKALFSEMSSITDKEYTKEDQDKFVKSLFKDKDSGKSIIDEQFKQEDNTPENDKVVEVNLKANIASLNQSIQEQKSAIKPIEVDAKIDNVAGIADGEGSKIDNVKNSVSELIAKIQEIGTAFDTANNSVLESSVKQISSIDSIAASVTNLKEKLQEVGATSVVEITKVVPDDIESIKQSLQKEKDELSKSQEEFLKQQEKYQKDKDDLKKAQEKFDNKSKKEPKLDSNGILETRNKLIEAAKNTKNFNIDEKSIKINKDGIVEFSATIEDLNGKLVQAKYKYDDFSKAITKGGKLSQKELNNNILSIDSVSKNNQLLYATEKTKGLNIDKKSIKIDDSGIISFKANIEKAGEDIRSVKFEVEDLNSILTKTGSISQSFLKGGTDIASIESLADKEKEYIDAITQRRKFEESVHPSMSKDDISEKQAKLIEEEKSLEAELNTLINQNNLSATERLAIQEKINQAKKEELNLYSADENNKTLYQKQKNYDKTIESIDVNNLINKDVNVDGKVVNLISKVKELQSEAEKAMNVLTNGTFESKTEFDNAALSLQKILDKLNILNTEDNKIVNNKGSLLGSISLKDGFLDNNKLVEEKIKELLSVKNEIVKNVSYNPSRMKVTADVINDGQIKKATINLKELQGELNNTSADIRVLYSAEKEYVSVGQKWANGFKAKINNLTQYVTGIELVMRAWNQVQQGFTFVKDLDSQLTTINQTMSVTRDELSNLGSSSIDTAKNLGSTANDVLDAVAIYANANETAQSILEKAKPTVMLANASGADTSTAADWIQGVVNQYKDLEGQEMRIINSYEKISAGLSVDFSKGINSMSEAISVSGASAKEAGLSLEEYQSIIGKIVETQRIEGSQAGNAMKTILARVSRSKTDENGEDVSAEDRSTIAKAYKEVADIDLYSIDGEFQDFGKTLDQLSEKWDTLTDSQKNYMKLNYLSRLDMVI